ncbi:hypothetical protein WJX81_008689 [Elliptochloris bilobata]|uniref:PPPDE domain-containing protein n=1 Tax=Elliptochloris bilobata TaxID=381761 RepID=A0AAW1QLL0_9CHLO
MIKTWDSNGDSPVPALTKVDFAAPVPRPLPGEQMCEYLERLRTTLDTSTFQVKQAIDEPGVYIGKRKILCPAGSQAALLTLAGTVFYHVVVYVKEADNAKVIALDFGPVGADITANLAEAVPAGPILQDPADLTARGGGELPLLRACAPQLPLNHPRVQEALEFAQGRAYHALANNCISTSDFLVRVLTNGVVRGAPLVFDALCGHAAAQDSPLLLMFMLMTQLSWFDVCDGSRLAAAFLQHRVAQGGAADEQKTGAKP